jgi:hypothetical protein
MKDFSKFPWTYDSHESCYLLAGQVTVTPTDGRKPATFGKGDFVTLPAGMVSRSEHSCWQAKSPSLTYSSYPISFSPAPGTFRKLYKSISCFSRAQLCYKSQSS